MTKEEIMAVARATFTAGVRMIHDNDRDGIEKANKFWKGQEARYCHTKQEHYWWETGFLYKTEKDRAEFEAWNEQYWKIAHALKEAGLSEKESNKILWIWNDLYTRGQFDAFCVDRNTII